MYVVPAPTIDELRESLSQEQLTRAMTMAIAGGVGGVTGEYLHWDKLRHLTPPESLTAEQWWLVIKFSRQSILRAIPLTDTAGRDFRWAQTDEVFRMLHDIDQRCSGSIAMLEPVTGDADARRHYLVNSLMEEAIRSSQLEGATTTRGEAKAMLMSGRSPRDHSEKMILNNYQAMQFVRTGLGESLSPDDVMSLHRVITEGTLDDPGAAGRMQTPDETRIAVWDRKDEGRTLHVPPPAEELPARMRAMCEFANGDGDGDSFVHPVVRAVFLHFWLAYDHPFEDGNGRTARALFYWYMRKSGYWLVEYLSVSRILRDAPSKYARAYLLTETDESDLTYFLLYQLRVIIRALDEFDLYMRRKVEEIRSVERLVKAGAAFNHRQMALISHALRNAGARYTYAGHAGSHGVTHETARNDLNDLVSRGILERTSTSRPVLFVPVSDLRSSLESTT